MQGDCYSPAAFNIFINDLTTHLKDLDISIKINNTRVPIMLYADDVVILANDEHEMQKMLGVVDNWCSRWKMCINMTKSKVIHFRPKGINRCIQQLTIGKDLIEYVNVYKYLGVYFNEKHDRWS